MFHLILKSMMSCTVVAICATTAVGHGLPIYIEVDATTNEVIPPIGFDIGEFESHPSFGRITDSPGIGVLGLNDGIGPGDRIEIRPTQGLLYWNGTELASTDATLTVNSAETIESFAVTENSELQEPLTWGAYPDSPTPFWDLDGQYGLSAGSAPGVYGLVVQIGVDLSGTDDNPVPTKPILIAFSNNFGPFVESSVIDVLRAEIVSNADSDFDRNWETNEADLQIWQSGFGLQNAVSSVQGDTNGDFDVDGFDFLRWQQGYASAVSASPLVSIPEPASLGLAAFGIVLFAVRFHEFYRGPFNRT